MKKVFRIISLGMIGVCSFSLFACSDTAKEKEEINYDNLEFVEYASAIPDVEGTIHEREIGSTNGKIVENGVTDYQIVLPDDAGAWTKKALTELNTMFEEATGKRMTVAADALSYTSTAKYISLGKTTLLEDSGLTIDYATLGTQGYEILTEGQSIFVAGADKGVYYGVLDLLGELLNFDVFTINYYSLDKNVKELALPDFDIKEVPDFENRIAPFGSVFSASAVTRDRMRFLHTQDYFIKDCQTHSAYNIVPLSNKEKHPKWFSADEVQLCYTAHGDAEEYEALIDYSVESCKQKILADPERNVLSFSQRDYNVWCNCDTCAAMNLEYGGTDAASQIKFINEVAKRVEAWLEEEEIGREIMFDILVYHKTEKAPAVKNADGTWSAIDETVVLRDNVQVFVAPIFGDFTSGVMTENAADIRLIFDSWKPIAKQFAVWGYDNYFHHYLAPYDSFGAMQDFCKYFYNANALTYFPQGSYNLKQSSSFDNLKVYLYSKLMWNVNIDMTEATHDYFEGLYRDAAEKMEQAYYQQRAELFLHRLSGLSGEIYNDPVQQKYYGKRYLVGQLDALAEAMEALSQYKESDPEYYAVATEEITLETVGPRYLLIELYSGTYSDQEFRELATSFIDDVLRLDVNKTAENDFMTSYITKLESKINK